MVLLVRVVNQKLKTTSNIKSLVSGSQEFVQFKFSLDSAWDNLIVFAQFIQDGNAYNSYLDENNCVYLPSEIVAGTFDLLLYGTGDNVIATTNYLTYTVDENALVSDAQSTEITLSLYQQLINAFQSMVGTPLASSTVAGMTDTKKIYVYTGSEDGYTNGNWYYYDSSAWVSGGVYNATVVQTDTSLLISGMPADSAAVGEAIANVVSITASGTTLVIS